MEISKEVCSANILRVAVETNCPRGGDTGHGGLTRFTLEDLGGTDIECVWNPTKRRIEIKLGGDSECDTFIECLEFAAKELSRQCAANCQFDHDFGELGELREAILKVQHVEGWQRTELILQRKEWEKKYTESQAKVAQLSARIIELQELLAKRD